MQTVPVRRSATLHEAQVAFLQALEQWVDDCMAAYGEAPVTDVHDQLTYTTAWEVVAPGRPDVLAFLKTRRDQVCRHFVDSGQWRHGYWRMHEAHHGTEHFELFMGMMARLDPADAETRRQIVDVAEHLGNWSADVLPWFDWDTGLYHSMFFGADGIKTDPGLELNIPDHFRCINIALIAHDLTDDRRYLDLAQRHVGRWAQAILEHELLPLGFAPSGPINAIDATLPMSCGPIASSRAHRATTTL